MVAQLVMKLPTFYGTLKFITVFTRFHYWDLHIHWASDSNTCFTDVTDHEL